MEKMVKKRRKRSVGEIVFIIGMLFIPLAHFLVFWLYKNFDSILLAFQTPVAGGGIEWGFDNFATLFKEFTLPDSTITGALKNTFIFFGVDLLVTFPLSIVMAYFIYKRVPFFRGFRVIFYLPCIIASTVTSTLFKYIIAGNGPIAQILEHFGRDMPSLLANSDYALNTILFYTVFFGLGANLVLFSGALNQIDTSVLESARIDGANRFQELIFMIVPLMWPTLSTVLTFTFVGLFGASGPILLFTQGAYGTQTLSYWIFHQVYYGSTYYYPAAVGLFFTLIGAPIALLMRWLLSKGVDDVAG